MSNVSTTDFTAGLVSGPELGKVLAGRLTPFVFEKIHKEVIDKYILDGWTVDKKLKKQTRMRKPKPVDQFFEDQVWSLFSRLGFQRLNRDRTFKIPYSEDGILTQQVDVFAADEETILIIECKFSEEQRRANFKEMIEAIGGKKQGLINSIRKAFPDTKFKIKFILATRNYQVGDKDKERLASFDIVHFDDEFLNYFGELSKHLGKSARFQLLGHLFPNQTIPELEIKVPAISGRMGPHVYYSFSLEPEKLLKISFVLHRRNANNEFMPTYQRLIKKTRLKSIQKFIDLGGYFPNSIIVNLTNKSHKIQFDPAGEKSEDTKSRLGYLHLPAIYRSAYIIDGQHRLFAYAGSKFDTKHVIPVVAFVDLENEEQVRLFMQINENQKSVPKNLQNTLNSDLLWDSESLSERIVALKLHIAQRLGEDPASPLYDRVIVGESDKTSSRCITIETIRTGLDRSNFFGDFSKTEITRDGTFFRGDNETTLTYLYPFLLECFFYIRDNLETEWNKGDSLDGFLCVNAGIESLIRIFSDIVDYLIRIGGIEPKKTPASEIFELGKPLLDALIDGLSGLSSEEKLKYKKSYGSAGKASYWRTLQRIIREKISSFSPDGLDRYIVDSAKTYNEESFKMTRDIETHLKAVFREKLQTEFGSNWFKLGVPQKVYIDANNLKAVKELDEANLDKTVDAWDCLTIIDYRKIATHNQNWSKIFEKMLVVPGEEKKGTKDDKTSWMQKLERIRNQNFHSYSVSEEEYQLLKSLHGWLVK